MFRTLSNDVRDAITAARMGEWKYALPGFLFRLLP